MNQVCTVPSFTTRFKVGVVGAGNVGAAGAYAMLIDGTPTELCLVDRNKEKVEALALDLEHSLPFFENTMVTASDDFSQLKEANLVFITAGARQEPGETRLDLVEKNRALFKDIVPKIVHAAPEAILVVVTNPVDVMTYETAKISGLPWGRVFGTGTMLDTARFQFHIGEKLCLSPKSVEAFILGEHGDSSFPVLSAANVAGKSLLEFEGFDEAAASAAFEAARAAAYKIIGGMGYTCYSIGVVMREIMIHIFQHSRIVLPLSVPLQGYHGHHDVALSVPCVLDSTGVAMTLEIPLSSEESQKMHIAVDKIKEYL